MLLKGAGSKITMKASRTVWGEMPEKKTRCIISTKDL